jgi:hypothetical protein
VNTTQNGLWLIGIGSALVVAAELIGAERVSGGLSFSSRFTSFRDRFFFGLYIAGLSSITAGSLMVMVTEFADWWFVPLSLIAVGLISYKTIVWKLNEYRTYRKREIERTSRDPWQLMCAELCSTWRWALQHPLTREEWPKNCFELPGAPARDEGRGEAAAGTQRREAL